MLWKKNAQNHYRQNLRDSKITKPGAEYSDFCEKKCVSESHKNIRIYQAQNVIFIIHNVHIYYLGELKIHLKPFKVVRSSCSIFLSVWTYIVENS